MNWKETLLDKGDITGDFYSKMIAHQAEISFKAGIKEVVDYIECRAIPNSFMPINTRTQWEEQLKEWGITPD